MKVLGCSRLVGAAMVAECTALVAEKYAKTCVFIRCCLVFLGFLWFLFICKMCILSDKSVVDVVVVVELVKELKRED